MTETWRDLGFTLRLLSKAPGYAVAAIVTLAMAIGANSAVFSAVYAVLLKPLPIRDTSQLAVGWGIDPSHGLPVVELPYRLIDNVSRNARSFSRVAAMGSTTWPAWLKGRGPNQRVSLAGVSAPFFDTLGALPALGRTFRPEEDVPNAPRVVILSYGTWLTRFGADPSIIGTRIDLDDRLHTVVGVMPRGFDVPRGTEFWTPVVPFLAASSPDALDNVGVLYLLGRLAPGVALRAAREELKHSGRDVALTPFIEYTLGPVRQALWALLAAVAILLVISCANVSGLMLTRVSLRRREHGIRLALGARSSDLARSWIVETLLLSIAGGALGLIASRWIVKVLVALAPEDIPRLTDVAINGPVAGFSFAAILATALLCGIGPVRQAVATSLVSTLNDGAHTITSLHTRRLRSALVVLQIGLSVVLLIAATLVSRSFFNLRRVDLGFQPSGVLTMNVAPDNPKPSASAWIDELLMRVRRLPNVDAAGAVYLRPFVLGVIGQETSVILEGQPDTPAASQRNPALNYEVATPGYFQAMRIALKRGRLFDARDDRRSPRVAIVSEATARRLWPGEDPIGKRVLLPSMIDARHPHEWRTVIGVVGDVRYRGIDDVRFDLYDAADQAPLEARTIVIRASQDPVSVAAAVQAEARRLDPNVFIDGLTTLDAAVARIMAPWRFSAWTFGVFAAFAFALAVVGLFSMVMLDVAHRERELAIRIAVGARRLDLLRSVLVPAGWRLLGGTLFGIAAALAGSRALQSLLFGIESIDGGTYAGVIAVVVGVVSIASYLPARKAARSDPTMLFTRQ